MTKLLFTIYNSSVSIKNIHGEEKKRKNNGAHNFCKTCIRITKGTERYGGVEKKNSLKAEMHDRITFKDVFYIKERPFLLHSLLVRYRSTRSSSCSIYIVVFIIRNILSHNNNSLIIIMETYIGSRVLFFCTRLSQQ